VRTLDLPAGNLRQGDTFTPNNSPEMVGRTVTMLAEFGGPIAVGMSDDTAVILDRRCIVEVER
jgi:hypothetical protein